MRQIRHVISIADLGNDELRHLVARSAAFASGAADPRGSLGGRVVGIYFRKTSTRTRTAFSSGALRLGAQIVTYGPGDLQENTGESAADTGRVLARMLDAFVVRTAGSEDEMRMYAAQPRMAVINAMSAEEHPTQAVADLATMLGRFGALEGLRVLYVGEGNNTASALALALARFRGAELHLRTPPGYGLAADRRQAALGAAAANGARLEERHDMAGLPGEVDVIYTTRWETTGTTKPDPDWRRTFAPFHVDEAMLERYPGAVFLHDLPANRGEEVAAAVLDGPRSLAFDQAENKLHSAMAVLEWCVADGADGA